MPLIDTTTFDFSNHHAGGQHAGPLSASVTNSEQRTVLHVGVQCRDLWIDVFPSEFALSAGERQELLVEIAPERAKGVLPQNTEIVLYGQYLTIGQGDSVDAPADVELHLQVLLPNAVCPNCGRPLPDGAADCRFCGERIRPCPVCAAPNTWIAHFCRRNPLHVIRSESDWTASPGGTSSRNMASSKTLAPRLSRSWSVPQFQNSRAEQRLEWCAPLASFGMLMGSAMDPITGGGSVHAFELQSGSELWEFELPGGQGIYPDQGGLAVDDQSGNVFSATLGGEITAIDGIRGTLIWAISRPEAVFAAPLVLPDALVVPIGRRLEWLDKTSGELLFVTALVGAAVGGLCADEHFVFAALKDQYVGAFQRGSETPIWTAQHGQSVRAPLLVDNGSLFVCTTDGTISALKTSDGAIKWTKQISVKSLGATPALSADGLLYVPGDDGYIHIVDAQNGNTVRSRRIADTPIRCSPVVSGHTAFVGADDGCVYAIDSEYHVERVYETSPGTRISCAGLALYGDTVAFAATDGILYVLRSKSMEV